MAPRDVPPLVDVALEGSAQGELDARGRDRLLILGERHLDRVLAQYVRYFNADRPHQGLAQQTPAGDLRPANTNGRVVEMPVLGGLHHAYRRAS
jgi:hypothetical protein